MKVKADIASYKDLQRQAEQSLNIGDEVIAWHKGKKIRGSEGTVSRKSANTITVILKNKKETRIPLTTNPKWSRFWRFEPANMEHGGGIMEIDNYISEAEQDIPDELIEKRLNRIGKTVVNYGGIEIPILSERDTYDKKNVNIWIGKYGSQMGQELVVFNKSYNDKEDALNEIREKIKEVHERFITAIERKKEINNEIDDGAKYFSNYGVKNLIIEALPRWTGSQTNAMTGSDYLNFAGHKLRFSDHQRPYNSKWNFIHGENHIDAITGFLKKENITEWIDKLTKNKLSDSDKEKISEYFDKMPTPKKETIEYPKMKNGGQVSKNHTTHGINDYEIINESKSEKIMTLGQITEILDKAQIRYNSKLSHIYGSQYWTIGGLGYRLSDHPKSEWRQSENIEIPLYKNNYQSLYDQLISRKDIDLKDKTEYEQEYIELAKKTIIQREKDGLLKTPDGNLYHNNEQGLANATKGMWKRKVYFPIKNKALNNYVKRESLKKELDNAYENGTKEEIDAIKKQLAEKLPSDFIRENKETIIQQYPRVASQLNLSMKLGGNINSLHSSPGTAAVDKIKKTETAQASNHSVIVAGIFIGPPHEQGGISCNGGTYELEGGEAFIDEDFAILTPQKSIYEGTPARIFDQVLAEQGVKKQKITEATCNLPAGYVLCKAAMQSDEMIKKTHEDTYKSLFNEINKDFGGLEFKKGGKLPKAKGGEIFVIKPQTKNNIKVYTIYDTSNNNQEVEDWDDYEIAKEVAEGMNENMKPGGPIKDIYLVQNDLEQNEPNGFFQPTNPAHFTAPPNQPTHDDLCSNLRQLIDDAEPRRRFLVETNRLTELCELNECCDRATTILNNGKNQADILHCCNKLTRHVNGTQYGGGGAIGSQAITYRLQVLSHVLQEHPITLPKNEREFIADIVVALLEDEKISKREVDKFAKNNNITNFHQAQELTELAIVKTARSIALKQGSTEYKYNKIVELYQRQPNLAHRTSTTFLKQQYSTPAPIGYLAGIYAIRNKGGWKFPDQVFEPSAGNGLLTIASKPENFIVNELDDTRRKHLWTQGYKEVWNKDASEPFTGYENSFDAVITNPPFGSTEPVQYDGFEITGLEHLMALRALDTMRDTGRAAIIIGGHTKHDELGRIQAGKNRNFFMYLHKHYQVHDVINISGNLYSRMGTSFDIRLILIAGRKANPEGLPPLNNPALTALQPLSSQIVEDWDGLFERINKTL